MALQPTDIADLAAATRPQRYLDRATEMATEYQKLVAMSEIMKQNKITHSGGDEMEVFAITGFTNTTSAIGLHNVDVLTRGDHLTSGTIPWRTVSSHMVFDLREKALNSSNAQRIINFVKLKRQEMLISRAVAFEGYLFGKPSASTDTTTPHGLDSYITYPAAFSAAGFVGVNPPGFTSGVIHNSPTYPRWANWYNQYTSVEQTDLISKMCDGEYETGFKSPIPNPLIPNYADGDGKQILTCWNVVKKIRGLQRDQNDDLGPDVGVYHDAAVFHGRTMTPVPYLDSSKDEASDLASYDPLYCVDWSVAQFEYLSGWDDRETKREVGDQHLSVAIFQDSMYNFAIRDRRKQQLYTTAIA